jgi:hypothetical protein
VVPQGIVYLLETVKVQKKQRPLPLSITKGLVQVFSQIDMKKVAVTQIGEFVMIGQVAELSFGFFPFRDIPDNTGHNPALIGGHGNPEGYFQGKNLIPGCLPQKLHMVTYSTFLPFCQGKQKITADSILNPPEFSGWKKSRKGTADNLFGSGFENAMYLGVGVDNTEVLGNLDYHIRSCFRQGLIATLQIFKFPAIAADLLTRQGGRLLRFRNLLLYHDIFSLSLQYTQFSGKL